jgi:hypothetical protein
MHAHNVIRLAIGFASLIVAVGALTAGIVLAEDPDPGQDPESGEALALATPKTCDSNVPPKYYCTWIRYVEIANSTNWELRKRLYKGARDGGAKQWQLWYAKDWYWGGSSWVWLRTAPSSSWFTNVVWDVKRNAGSMVQVPRNSAVTIRLRYQECDVNNPLTCWFWCSSITQHNLNGGTSQQFGGGGCTGDGVTAMVPPQ